MHAANHFYGHAQVFADYAGVEFPMLIDGYLQHGWNLHDGFAVGTDVVPGAKLFVWSEAVARRGWAMGRRSYHVIGSAWAYLLAMEAAARHRLAGSGGHDLLPLPRLGGPGGHRRPPPMLARLQEVETGPITVCLYWVEHRDPAIRAVYEEPAAG